MNKIIVLSALLLMAVSFAGLSIGADYITIDTSEGTPFLYESRSYVPLRSIASFLGAQLQWDSAKGQAVVTYNGQDLALTPNVTKALFAGQPVTLTAAPVVANRRTYVTAETFRRFYNVPVEWDKDKSQVRIKGPNGWGVAEVKDRPPWHGGPPPWAPAWGARRHDSSTSKATPPGQDKQRKDEPKQKSKDNEKGKDKADRPKKGD